MKVRKIPESSAAASRVSAEGLIQGILNSVSGGLRSGPEEEQLIEDILRFRSGEVRVVVLGGGTGLSTVVGGESRLPDWPDRPFVGLKEAFSRLSVVVVTTDDGGSTGKLLQQLPMIGIGDLRKCCLSLVRAENLRRRWKLDEQGVSALVRVLAGIFNYRFPESGADRRVFRNPLRAIPLSLRAGCPEELASALASLTGYLSLRGKGPTVKPEGHCLGNLLLTAAIFRAAGRWDRPPSGAAVRRGVDEVSRLIGVEPGSLHPATPVPGQLKFRYTNGVEVYGQQKSARARRGCPVERVTAEFVRRPTVPAPVLKAVREADLIVYAPGSLYTSMIPLLQLRPLADAVRANRRAMKILAANFWIQEGETDISPREVGRGFLVSDLIDSYDRTIPGGTAGLFDTVLSASLDHVPANILRNYALEGKVPIHLDRKRVEALGLLPVEAMLFPPPRPERPSTIHHDPVNFALAVRTLYYLRRFLNRPSRRRSSGKRGRGRRPAPAATGVPLCRYRREIGAALQSKRFRPKELREIMLDLAWENRDILPGHFSGFKGVRLVGEGEWSRSTEWDNVLGYFDPDDRELKIHRRLLKRPERLREDLLIALGESLLGRYLEKRRWPRPPFHSDPSSRCYEIRLRPPGRRECFLSDRQLHRYLQLARMVPDRKDPLVYRITINDREGFLPPGLLFGLLYAWYLDDAYGSLMDYEMALLRWPEEALMPYQVQERRRKRELVAFFREEVFRP
ncbi:MAG: YvcK family protein [Candidatus Erginobacter occultus]|nr:YvcK family protein [Candidatus Erginobacter occultus]